MAKVSAWELRIGLLARDKKLCKTSIILSGQKKKIVDGKFQVDYVLCDPVKGMVLKTEEDLLKEYDVVGGQM